MATIMENDMIKGSAPLRPDDLKKLSELPRYQISRQQATIWAHRDIKFLAYDDTDLRENGYDSDDEEGMLNLAMKMSQGSSAGEGSPKDGKYMKHSDIEETQAEASTSGPIGDDEPESCKFCSFIPEFPHSWRPRKFRLVQPQIGPDTEGELPGGESICCHYVAISYCWPAPQKDEHGKTILTPGTYQVRDLDGTVRTNRCLDDVLDRAVDFAVSCGMRLIWIDQECLPQPTEESPQEDKDYQELGVQAMDIVYNRAVVTAGLLKTEITNQTEMDAIYTLMAFGVDESGRGIRWEGPGPAPRTVDFQLLNHVLNFLERISADRWYTRCWVAQESLSAGNHLMVVLRRGPGLSYRSHFEFQGRARPPPSPSTRDSSKRIQSNNVAIPVEDFHRLIQAAKFFLQRDFTLVGSALVRYGHERMSLHHAGSILAAAEALHPAAPNPRTLAEKVFIVGSNSYGPRQTVDAAGALTLLRTRECRDVQDRVAIVANMCNFENRLDTRALARNCKSLRLALVALTVLNGDYSLLAPEAYALEPCEDESK
ncbi:hypothetical protein VTN00DRAFT_10055 [Thermoascus crustaceus]|uniref:uncharacterized protein n=1 Tax=Thermoascus crustaceus TaxID=5088 RepID=UPI003742D0E7